MFKRPIQKTEDEEPIRRVPATRYSPDYKEGLSPEQVQGTSGAGMEQPGGGGSFQDYEGHHPGKCVYLFQPDFAILGVLLCVVGSFRI